MSAMAWIAAASCTVFVFACAFAWWRVRGLAKLRFDLVRRPVPASVLAAVRDAEARHYAACAPPRRALESLQDVFARRLPDLVALADWSVGPYRVRPSTVAPLLPWACARGYVVLHSARPSWIRAALAYFAVQAAAGALQSALVLEHLRSEHRQLRTLAWDRIAAEPRWVGVLYSGYLGAGGRWDEWRASTEPGDEARWRMRIDDGGSEGSGVNVDS